MDVKDLERLKKDQPEYGKDHFEKVVLAGIEQYATEGTPYDAHLTEDEYNKIIGLLALQTIQGEDVLQYKVYNTYTGSSVDSNERGGVHLQGEWPLEHLMERVVDAQGFDADFINDYKETILIKFDGQTVVALGRECTAAIEVCAACRALEDPETDEGVIFITNNAEYSCEHGTDSYSFKYWFAIWNAEDVNNYPSFGDWELDFFDTQKYDAERDALELAQERAAGKVKLARLGEGDLLRITAKRLLEDNRDSWRRSYTEAEINERIVRTLEVVEPGAAPICIVVEPANFQEKIMLQGSGQWTTRRQNPVQDQEIAMSLSMGWLLPGRHLIVSDPAATERIYSNEVIDTVEVIKRDDASRQVTPVVVE